MRSSALPLDDTTTRIEAATLLRLSRILNFMKSLKDIEGVIPESRPFSEDKIKSSERQKISKRLLQYFLDDGIVRGVDSDGRIYSHLTDLFLTQQFVKKIKDIKVAGSV